MWRSRLSTTYLEESLGCVLLLEGDEAKVLALLLNFIVRLLNASYGAILLEEFPDFLVGQLWLEFTDVDLPLLGLRLLHGHLLAFYHVVTSTDSALERGNLFEDDEAESSAPARVLVCDGLPSFYKS